MYANTMRKKLFTKLNPRRNPLKNNMISKEKNVLAKRIIPCHQEMQIFVNIYNMA